MESFGIAPSVSRRLCPPPTNVELKGVPSFTLVEHPFKGKDLLDRVSILNSPIPYSPEVKITSTEPSLARDAKIRKKTVRVLSWADASNTEVAMALVGANEAPLPFTYTISTLAIEKARARAGVGEVREAQVTSVCTNTLVTSLNDAIPALVSTGVDASMPIASMVL